MDLSAGGNDDRPAVRGEGVARKLVRATTLARVAGDLWGDSASRRDAVYLDLWDDYLERV